MLLLIHGFPTASWDWHRIVPSADGVLLADHIGHYPHVEDPEGVLRRFGPFTASRGRREDLKHARTWADAL